MAFISKSLRDFVTRRANGRCEYCQTPQAIVIEMEVDHIRPESAGGETIESNLCLSCIGCNHHKNDAQTGTDPQTNLATELFNPRTQHWKEHFRWSENGTQVVGLTAIGRATIERLKMNREIVIRARERWVKAGWHPPRE